MGAHNSSQEPYQHDFEKIERDAAGPLAKPTYWLGFYGNPFDTFESRNLSDVAVWKAKAEDKSDVPWYDEKELDKNMPIIKPDMGKLAKPTSNQVQMTWIGHAYVLAQFDGVTVMIDPVVEQELNKNLLIVIPDMRKLANPPSNQLQLAWIGHASVLIQFDGITELDKNLPTMTPDSQKLVNPPSNQVLMTWICHASVLDQFDGVTELDRNLPIITPDAGKLANPPSNQLQMTWIGHASVLVQFDGITVMTDPVFSKRCGPLGKVGHQRYRDPPCQIDDLPKVDVVVISHNHYDHMDFQSIVDLNRKFGDKLKWLVPCGVGKWLKLWGCADVTELTWWQECTVDNNGKKFTFAATPAQHYSMRLGVDRFMSLWCGWVVKGPSKSFYFAGDTGYCYAFKQIGRTYGPFSLAAIPIGAYEPRRFMRPQHVNPEEAVLNLLIHKDVYGQRLVWFMRPQHVNPEEAVYIHKDVRAERSVGIHWGTFKLTDEHYMEPKHKLAECSTAQDLSPNEFFTVRHGEVVTVEAHR